MASMPVARINPVSVLKIYQPGFLARHPADQTRYLFLLNRTHPKLTPTRRTSPFVLFGGT
jgi:hypothetical protein